MISEYICSTVAMMCGKIFETCLISSNFLIIFLITSDYSTSHEIHQRPPQVSCNFTSEVASSTGASNSSSTSQQKLFNKKNCNTYFTPLVLSHSKCESDNNKTNIIVKGTSNKLGYLDEVLSSPINIPRSKKIDSKKIAVILLETNILELQRHLLTVTVQNQVCII